MTSTHPTPAHPPRPRARLVAAAAVALTGLAGCTSTIDGTASPSSTSAAQATTTPRATSTPSTTAAEQTSAPAEGAAAAPVDGPLAGTWGLVNSLGNDPYPLQMVFRVDATVTLDDGLAPPTTAPAAINTWTLNGDQVTISLNSGAAVYTGTLSGNVITGTSNLTDDSGQPVTWIANRG